MPLLADLSEAERFLENHPDIRTFELLLPDMNGISRGKRIERNALLKIYKEGLCLPGSVFGADITGETIEATGLGFDIGDRDQLCWPIAGSLHVIPWQDRPMAQLLLTMHELDHTPFFADPQQVLESVLQRFEELKLHPQIAVELEFYLIDRTRGPGGEPQPPISPATGEREHSTQVYGMNELDDYREVFETITDIAHKQGIPAETAVAEYAPGQYEVNLRYRADVQLACRDALMLKRIIKVIAAQHGMEATFMARPYDDYAGSGTHIHISMLDDAGNNVFCGDTELGSDVLRHAVGGLFATMEESMAIYAPNANSYRRFQEDSYVPLAKTWGWNNRTVAVRIPTGADEARRVEHRVAGADANPFLLTAVLLAGIHHGITQHIEPAEPVAGNAYQEPHAPLPARWYEALAAFEQRSILGDYLDPRFCKAYLASKHAELRQFEARITPTEYQWYLRLV